ncbi:unnamed protein product [Rotaria sp. Silwood1]|nr:unnamed protein product [Rotaria sp. Silwood1]
MTDIIDKYLSTSENPNQFNCHLQHFLSTIISRKSWEFLLNRLKSNELQKANGKWADDLHDILKLVKSAEEDQYLQSHHRIQFTLSSVAYVSGVFPNLHQFYSELSEIIDNCVKQKTEEQYNILSNWINDNLNSNPKKLALNEIKAMLILKIYYDYYCRNELQSISFLLGIIERNLQPLPEELTVFRALLQPEQYIIGYRKQNENDVENHLINLFRLDFKDVDELCIRHALVNLMAMIIMGGSKSFLWTFAFKPLELKNTYGKCFHTDC